MSSPTSVFLFLVAISGLLLVDRATALISCLDNSNGLSTVRCTTSCLTTYDAVRKSVKQGCSVDTSCSMDHLYIENSADGKIKEIKHCCISQDNCNWQNLAHRVYVPLPFALSSCFENLGEGNASTYAACQTSCEARYNIVTHTITQQCSQPETACKSDKITFDSKEDSLKFCCVSSNNCNLIDISKLMNPESIELPAPAPAPMPVPVPAPAPVSTHKKVQPSLLQSLNGPLAEYSSNSVVYPHPIPHYNKPLVQQQVQQQAQKPVQPLQTQKLVQPPQAQPIQPLKPFEHQQIQSLFQKKFFPQASSNPLEVDKYNNLNAIIINGDQTYRCRISNKKQSGKVMPEINLEINSVKHSLECIIV